MLGCNTPLLLEIYKFLSAQGAEALSLCHTEVGIVYVHDYINGRALEDVDSRLLTIGTLDLV